MSKPRFNRKVDDDSGARSAGEVARTSGGSKRTQRATRNANDFVLPQWLTAAIFLPETCDPLYCSMTVRAIAIAASSNRRSGEWIVTRATTHAAEQAVSKQ